MEKITLHRTTANVLPLFLLILSVLLVPYSASASTISIDTGRSEFFVGDTILLSVRIDSENKTINAIEGIVALDYPSGGISLVDINTSGSKFSLWPGKPLPSAENMSISFAGGSPGGLTTKDGVVFNIVATLQQAGQLTLTPSNIQVYLHDGKGTQDTIQIKPLAINVAPKRSDTQPANDWSDVVSRDTTPPEAFEIVAGQDASVFDGKKFLSFYTTDKQSDITHYEVRENNLPPVRSDTTYILKEQTGPVTVLVTAYDSAGNTRESTYSSTQPNYVVFIVVCILIYIVLRVLLRITRRIRKQ